VSMNYTWSHAIDNLSSSFFEAQAENQYGNTNITTNNGVYNLGFLDPYHPNLDRGDAEFDLRQRVTVASNWRIPFKGKGLSNKVLGGWSLNPLFVAHTGQPYSVFNCGAPLTLTYNCERAVFNGPVPNTSNGLVANGSPDSYNYLTFAPSQVNYNAVNPMTPGSVWPSGMSGRDAFRAPGWWNLDFGLYKDTRINERWSLQLRAEAFNLFNHANLYVVGTSANVGSSNSVSACYGCTGSTYDRRNMQLAAKLIF